MARISQKEAKKLCQNYLDTKAEAMEKIVGKADANAIWFDLKGLRDFLTFARRKGKRQNQIVNGVRDYLGSYDSDRKQRLSRQNHRIFFCNGSEQRQPRQRFGLGCGGV